MRFDSLLHHPLSSEELFKLNESLIQKGGLTVFEAHGLLCATLSGPNIVRPHIWFAAIWGEDNEFDSMEEVENLSSYIMRLNNQIANDLLNNELFTPLFDYAMTPLSKSMLLPEQEKNLELWCEGYLYGMSLDQEKQAIKYTNVLVIQCGTTL